MKFKLSTAVVVLGASLLGLPIPASAAQLAGFTKNMPERISGSALVQKVRRRRRRRRNRGNAAGAAAAGAAIGFFGAIIANEAAKAHERRVEDCYRRHRRGYFYRDGERVYCDEL
jgi:hypothetical protein